MIQSILSNLAIIFLMHIIMGTIMNYKERLNKIVFFLSVGFLFSSAVISMFFLPIEFGEYKLDLRLIPLIFLALFRGSKLTISVLSIVSVWGYFLGGMDVVSDIIFGMIIPTLFVLALSNENKSRSNYFEKILIITGCWFISDIPIIFLNPNGMEKFQKIFLWRYISFLGAAVILYIFVLYEHSRRDLRGQLQFLAWHDPLTKLINKSRFFEVIEEKLKDPNVNHYLAMIDMDYFKRVNDTYGHVAGDQVLIKVAEIFKQYESDHLKIGRYGGEEFILYQGHTSFEQAVQTLETIRKEIRATLFVMNQGVSTHVTVSIGLAKIESRTLLQEAVKQADKNLYRAKENGRDQVVTFRD